MKKIYIATFITWKSFGAVLQATALNNFINELGYDCYTINYQMKDISRTKKNFKAILYDTISFLLKYDAKRRSDAFRYNNIVMTPKIQKYEQLKNLVTENSFFVAGSDQIWHPNKCYDFFFLRFLDKQKKISYAASMGSLDIPEDKCDKFKEYVNAFDFISVREKSMIPLIKGLTEKECTIHIDPTLLMSKSFWEKRESICKIDKPYILLYPLYWNEKYNVLLKELHEKTGFEIVCLSPSRKVFCTKRILDADPGQFLYLIHYAESVVTSSFHGTIFSLIYRKPLRVVVNPEAPSRIKDLLSLFGFSNVIADEDSKNVILPNYSEFDMQLEIERNRAKEYLLSAFGDLHDKDR